MIELTHVHDCGQYEAVLATWYTLSDFKSSQVLLQRRSFCVIWSWIDAVTQRVLSFQTPSTQHCTSSVDLEPEECFLSMFSLKGT
jgi:hypothetical protein